MIQSEMIYCPFIVAIVAVSETADFKEIGKVVKNSKRYTFEGWRKITLKNVGQPGGQPSRMG